MRTRRAPQSRLPHRVVIGVIVLLLVALSQAFASTGARLRSIGSLDVAVHGLAATVDPLEPTVPKNVAAGVRVVVKAGDRSLSAEEVASFLGGAFEVHAEISGPGLDRAITLPEAGSGEPIADPLLLPLPALPVAGDYALSNIRLVRDGRPLLDVSPSEVTVRVIDQVLVTSVQTRPLTLDEIREKGIVLDSDDYLGFEFTIGLATDSQTVSFSMPVVFDRQGVPVPQVIEPPPPPPRIGVSAPGLDPPMPLIVPAMLEFDPVEIAEIPPKSLLLPSGQPIHIPSVLVIPGNVGYLKQFFSAQLFVANGAPAGSGLSVRNVTGTVKLPPGADFELGTADDPLSLPETIRGPQPETMPVRGLGFDGEPATADDVDKLDPAQQGQAEFLIRGEKEGFYPLEFDVNATLDGLAIGPVGIKGKARGGVLVRNPFFDMTFTVPSVVRKGEKFPVFATVTNIGQGIANDVTVTLDSSRISGATIVGDQTLQVDTLRTGDAKTLKFEFLAQRTGQVQATYLNFDTGSAGGNLKFTLGVGERGIALSPDTLVLPAAVDELPLGVVEAAMRVLGQAWSIANAPTGTLPAGVTRVDRSVATEKALALAEAGLRVSFGQASSAAVRDLAFDFYGGKTLDPGFDQLLRETQAGHDLARAIGFELRQAMHDAGGTFAYGASIDRVAASGPDYLRIGIGSGVGAAPVSVAVKDAAGRRTAGPELPGAIPESKIPGAVWLPLGSSELEPLVGLLPIVTSPVYTLELTATGSGSLDLSVTAPYGAGRFVRGVLSGLSIAQGARARLVVDLRQPGVLMLELDPEGDGTFDQSFALSTEIFQSTGPELVSATVVGPETIDGASPFGFHVALLFDRVVDPASGGSPTSYSIAKNAVQSARSQLSGRFVFASLEQPEGPYVPTLFATTGVLDQRGARGPPRSVALGSRLADPGAVVSGRVIGPDGEPVTTGKVTYQNNSNWQCLGSIFEADPNVARSGFAAVPLDATGHYEFRYVRQDQCGYSWAMHTQDPRSGALRTVTGYVRSAGEHIVLDIALLGQGSVKGVVRDLAGAVVPGAAVTVVSQTDPQVGGTAVTDGDGRYEVFDITVGAVSVSAAKGAGVGQNSGNIARAGTSATVDVTLDSGAAAVGGLVVIEDGSSTRPAASTLVVYEASGVAVAVAQTDSEGRYFFESVPVGPFEVTAALNTRDRAQASGVVAAGEVLTNVDMVIVLPSQDGSGGSSGLGFGTVSGLVLLPDGSSAPDVIVSIGNSGALSIEDGTFEIRGVEVRPGQAQTVHALSGDGLRSGTATVFVNQAGQHVQGVVVVLSGLGSAEFTVLSAAGQPLVGQEVGLLDRCASDCGCQPKVSGTNGKVRFDDLPIGSAHAHAVRVGTSFVDVADATVSITEDGEVAQGTLRFAGSGTVSGVVTSSQGPVFGADVTLTSRLFNGETCGLGSGVSQRVRTNTLGQFRFQAVNLGQVSVTASQTFFPTPTTKSGTLTADGQEIVLDILLNEGQSTIAGELSGIVYLPDSVTPAGAGIEVTASGGLPDVVVSTDANGRYRFAKIFPEGGYTLTVRDPITGGLAQTGVYLRTAEDLTRDIRLLGRGTVLVRVVDANNVPLQKAFVRLKETSFPGREFEGAADASSQGVARFDNVFEGPVSAEATDATGRGGRAAAVLAAPGATLELEVRMSITGSVSGLFVAADGSTPVPFGAVTLIANGHVLGQTTTQGSGEDVGGFSFENVPAGPFRVDAQDPATARTGSAVGSITSQDQVADVIVQAQGLGTVEGFVTSNGEAQAGADVELVAGSRRATTMSDAEGRYRVTGVPEGPVSVSASLGGGFLRGAASANLVGDGTILTLDVPLQDSGAVGGRVVRADGVTPASQSLVSIRVGGGATFSTLTAADGGFFFDRLPAGSASLSADVLGSIDQGSASVEIPAGGTANVTIALNGVGSIRGVALDSAGHPTAGTVVVAGTGPLSYSRTIATASDGKFFLPEILAGPFVASLTVQTSTFTLYGTATGTVAPDTEAFVQVQVQPSAFVRGRVLRADGETAALGSEVTLSLLPNRGLLTFYAGSDGRFEATGVPLGNFELSLIDRLSGGVGLVQGQTLSSNGEIRDLGDIVLDDTPVEAVAFEPADGSLGVSVNQPIRVTFSDRLKSAQGISVSNGSQSLGASSSLAADGLSVTLTGTWTDSSEITVTATTAVTDIYGRHPHSERSARFRTVDLSPPRVTSVAPPDQAIEVPADAFVDVTFSEELGGGTDFSTLVIVASADGAVLGSTVQTSATTVRFTPSQPLVENRSFTVSVNGATDVSGNRQTAAFTSIFKTHDTDPPVLALTAPPPGSWSRDATPDITFSLADALSGINAGTGTLAVDGAPVAPATSPTTLAYTPAQSLADGVHALLATVADRADNVGSLQAELRIDTQPPGPAAISGVAQNGVISGTVALTASATDSGSGVQRIEILSDHSSVKLTLFAPDFAGGLVTTGDGGLTEGAHVLTARAIDYAGNIGPEGTPTSVYADNQPLTVTITPPATGTSVRQSVALVAKASEAIQRMVFTAGQVSVTDEQSPYEAVLDLSGEPPGPIVITAQAQGFIGDTGSATLTIDIDRTPPNPPNIDLIAAEPPDNGVSLVHGDVGAVENNAIVTATNQESLATTSKKADDTGAFAFGLAGAIGNQVSLVATDAAGNTSEAREVPIRSQTSLPPVVGTLRYEGLLVDRVGGAGALAPGGGRDAVFSFDFALGANITRHLVYVDLEGPVTVSTRPEVATKLGVAKTELGAPFLNATDGSFGAPLTGSVSLLLFAPAPGLLQAGAQYHVTVAFTNGARFIGNLTLGALPQEEVASRVFSIQNDGFQFDPEGPPGVFLASETTSPTFTVSNDEFQFDPEGPPGVFLASETTSPTFSVFNEEFQFDPEGPPGVFLASETTSPTFSVFNEEFQFDPEGPPGVFLASETASPTFSVENNPPVGCGDGIVSGGEPCDDGNLVNGDGCDNNCTASGCGNGVQAGSEACDDGNAASGDGCDVNCTVSACGNRIVAGAETCDDGNATPGDGCTANCLLEVCGDGVANNGNPAVELKFEWLAYGCTSPTDISFYVNGSLVASDPSLADCTCTPGIRTLTVTDPSKLALVTEGENAFRVSKQGYLKWAIVTVKTTDGGSTELALFDPYGSAHNDYACNGSFWSIDQTISASLPGRQTEQCDDGNLADGDGCDTNCTLTACGNGIQSSGEACEDGNLVNGDGCDQNCTVTACGNGVVTSGEECDDANASVQDACRHDCTVARCGDGTTNVSLAAEALVFEWLTSCSPESAIRFYIGDTLVSERASGGTCTCSEQIQTLTVTDPAMLALVHSGPNAFAVQADGYLNWAVVSVEAEGADDQEVILYDADGGGDAEARNTNHCTSNYEYGPALAPVDALLAPSDAPEQCDDGNRESGDGCDANCTLTGCGNGIITGTETCEDGNSDSGDGCSADCALEHCGDGTVNDTVTPTKVTFEWLGYACESGEDDRIDFYIGDVLVASDETVSECTCSPGIRTLTVTDPALLELLMPGPNRFRVSRPAYLSWALATVELSDGTSNTGVLFDPTGSDATVRNDYACNAMFWDIEREVAVNVGMHSEECDDGNAIEGDACDSNCTASRCGNGIAGGTEGCDDGNTIAGDGCTLDCALEYCSDGVVNNGIVVNDLLFEWLGYDCDEGPVSGTIDFYANGELIASQTTMNCSCEPGIQAVLVTDTNALAHVTSGENAFRVNRDYYLSWALVTVNTSDGNSREIVLYDPTGTDATARNEHACDHTARRGVDRSVSATLELARETCDDTNLTSGDGCDENCKVTGCPNGILTAGEVCDDGNAENGDGCDENCTLTACGNGVVSPDEACDDGNASDADECLSDCTSAACGDGMLNVSLVASGVVFEWMSLCSNGAAVRFYINGTLVSELSSGDACTCSDQVPQSLTLTDPQALALLHVGANSFGVEVDGSYLSWVVATVQALESTDQEVVLYDAFGGGDAEARNPNPCASNYQYWPIVEPVQTDLFGAIEQCDDGNDIGSDGCETNCRLTP